VQAPDEETVDPDQLARPLGVDVRLGLRLAGRFERCAMPRDQGQALGARVQSVADERLVDAVGRDLQSAPFRAPQPGRDALGAPARVTETERDDPLLDDLGELVGHLRSPPLARPEHLQSRSLDLPLPAVIGRAVHTHRPARLRRPDLLGQPEQLQAVAEQHVILRHAALLHHLAVKEPR
jgi:hypothetical protein